MNGLTLYSEPFAATGNIAGEGFRKLLGRPALSLIQTVIRESIQNSVDAAIPGEALTIRLRYRALSTEQQKFLVKGVLAKLPASSHSSDVLSESLGKSPLRVLEIFDSGTSGLGGPTRADTPPSESESPDFVNFIRNVGAARDTHQGGGTYGYGKTSYYSASASSTILVDSLAFCGGRPVRRFIGCHLGGAFDAADREGNPRRFTGRHWWGQLSDVDGVDPLTGKEAADTCSALGMLPRDVDDSGTSVLILDPLFGSTNADEARDDLIEAVLWNFWPRMTESTPVGKKLHVSLEVEGEQVEIPKPEVFPPLDLYARALRAVREDADEVETVKCRSPKVDLGKLCIMRGMSATRIGPAARPEKETRIPRNAHAIALMRPVELVVKYLEGDPFPDSRFEWAGVFVCSSDDEVENAFASSEPPAHDDWCPSNLPKGHQKTYVNVGLRNLSEAAHFFVNPDGGVKPGQNNGPSLAATASRIGMLLSQTSGKGPGKTMKGGGGGGGGGTGVSLIPEFVRLETLSDGRVVSVFRAQLPAGKAHRVLAVPYLVMDGGTKEQKQLPPEFQARVHSMELLESGFESAESSLTVENAGGDLEIRLQMPRDAAVGLKLKVETGAGE